MAAFDEEDEATRARFHSDSYRKVGW
jgi:hypothetical protein